MSASSDAGKYGLMYYNSIFTFVPVLLLAYIAGDVAAADHFKGWADAEFVAHFCLSCISGFILNYSVLLCTQYNSALTTAVIGSLKNIIVTYLGGCREPCVFHITVQIIYRKCEDQTVRSFAMVVSL